MADAEPIESSISQIAALLEAGKAEEAITLAESALQSHPDAARLVMVYGISLGQAGRPDEGAAELRRATMLDPGDPEVFYNLAVQLYDMGNRREAAVAAREAITLHPAHEAAAEILAKCEAAAGDAPFDLEGEVLAPSVESLRTGPDNPPPSLLKLGPAWTRVGYGVLALDLIFGVLLLVHTPFYSDFKTLRHDPLSIFVVFLWPFSGLASVFWMLVDLIDRRERLVVWLLPAWICGLFWLPALPLAVYLFVGRKSIVFRSA